MSERRYNRGPPWPQKDKKHWGDRKGTGSLVCAVCGERIRKNKGERAVRHEKITLYLGQGKTDTFWTFRHKRCGPEEEGDKDATDTDIDLNSSLDNPVNGIKAKETNPLEGL